MIKLDSEKEKIYSTIAKFCKRHNFQEVKILLQDGTIVTWKSNKRSLK